MPQLAPLSWALAPLIFWALLLTLSSSMWWNAEINFPPFKTMSSSMFSNWKWN